MKTFTKEEVLAAMLKAEAKGHEFFNLKLIRSNELCGRAGALAGFAKALGINKDWINYHPPLADPDDYQPEDPQPVAEKAGI